MYKHNDKNRSLANPPPEVNAHNSAQPVIRFVSRTQARRYACSACGAAAGAPCFRYNGKPRISCHQERHDAAIAEGLSDGNWAMVRPVGLALFLQNTPQRW